MNKKVGIAITVFAAMMLLCCIGFIFTLKSAAGKLTEVIAKDQTFVTTVLNGTAKTWDEEAFSKFADPTFNTPSKRDETKKLFVTLKKNLGSMVSLGEVTPGAKAFRANADGSERGLLVSIIAKAKFEKGNGIFTVVVRNVGDKMTVTSISLDPDKTPANRNSAVNKP